MMKKTLSLLLALMLLVGALAGCSSTEVHSYTDDMNDASGNVYANAMTAYSANKQIATIEGTPVYWNEYAYWIASLAAQIASYSGETALDWDAVFDEESGQTYADMVKEGALQSLQQYHIIEAKAIEAGIEFDEAGEEYVQQVIAEAKENLIGEDVSDAELESYLKENYYLDLDVMRYQSKVQYYYEQLFAMQFGENGEKLGDAELNAYIEDNGFLYAKHILWMTTDEDGNDRSDEEKQAQLQKAQAAAAELQSIADQAAREARFDEIMNEQSEDPGLAYYPEGYVFQSGEMYEEFENGVRALEPYAVSSPVTTAAGYHVILRLPVTGESVIDYDSVDGSEVTLREQAALEAFAAVANGWMESADVQWESGFDTISLNDVFAEHLNFFQKLFHKS